MKNWSTVRKEFAAKNNDGSNNNNNDDGTWTPILKQARRGSIPELSKSQRVPALSKWAMLKTGELSLPSIDSPAAGQVMPVRREITFHPNGSSGSSQQQETANLARRLSLATPKTTSELLDTNSSMPDTSSLSAKRFAMHVMGLASRMSRAKSKAGSFSGPSAYTSMSMRDPARLHGLFRAVARSIFAWFRVYKRAITVTTTSYNLSDIMAMSNNLNNNSSNKNSNKKSSTTAALDHDGNVVKFNMDDYKSNITMKLTEKAKRILQKNPDDRTDDEIHHVMIALKSVPQISEYPLAILRLIVKYGFFESFEARRVLLRQGHRPAAFYFVVYGEVAVAVNTQEVGSMEPAKLAVKLKRGEHLGELAIITGQPRASTCVTLGYCEFIKLWKEEYVKIFKVGGMADFNNVEVMQFLTGSELMAGWPLDLLKSNPGVILFSYFKAGTVIVKDARKSQWLVILKSGRADAVGIIPHKTSCVSEKTGRLVQESEKSARQALSILFHLSKQEFDRELMSSRFRKIHSSWRINSTHPYAMSPSPLSCPPPNVDGYLVSDEDIAERAASFPSAMLPRNRRKSVANAIVAAARGGDFQLPLVPSHNDSKRRPSRTVYIDDQQQQLPPPESPRRMHSSLSRMSSAQTTSSLDTEGDETSSKREHSAVPGGRKTMFNVLNSPAHKKGDEDDEDAPPQASPTNVSFESAPVDFVALQQLGAGNVFGLESQLKLTDVRLVLLSRGCECILLKWDFFRQHCSDVKLAQIQTWAVSSNYPNSKVVEEIYQDEINWNSYRKFLVKSAISVARPAVV